MYVCIQAPSLHAPTPSHQTLFILPRSIVYQTKLPPTMFGLIFPIGMNLSNIILRNHIVILGAHLTTVIIVIDTLLAITVNDVFSQMTDSLISNLTFTGTLFSGEHKFHWIDSSSTLV